MASRAGGGSTSYEGGSGSGGGGAGGKFRKRPFRRSSHATPYDRPPASAALRNPGWLSKLVVDPASKLISASARLFFSSNLFRKRLPPAPPPPPHIPQPPEANQGSSDLFEEAVLDNPPGVQRPLLNDLGASTNSGNNFGLSDLEQMLKQKTFTRSEIDRLTELLHSRTIDAPQGDEDTRTKLNVPQPLSTAGVRHEFTRSPMQANGLEPQLESHKFHGDVSTPGVSSLVHEEDIAAPSELAKVYMGGTSMPSEMSPSRFGLRSQVLREGATVLNNGPYTPNSPVMSLVSKPAVRVGVPENGFITPRSRGRSAIYSMARTPYSRVNPTSIQKGTGTGPGLGGYGQSPSSSQFPWQHDGLYSSKQLALKRRSSALEDNIGSVGPIRRLRQKTSLSTPKSLSLQAPRSSFSSRGDGVGLDSTEFHLSLAHKVPSLADSKHRTSKALGENEDNSMPGTSYTPVPSKSTEMATKILQQLDRLVPKEKSPEGKAVAAREKSTSKLTNSTTKMVNGQAFRSLEDVDSSNSMRNAVGTHKFKDTGDTSFFGAQDTSSQKQENGPKMHTVTSDALAPSRSGNTPVLLKEAVDGFRTVESFSTQKFVTQPSQSKWGFQMSAHEDFLDMDDEIHSNKAASTLTAEGTKKVETSVVESKALFSEAGTVDKSSPVSDSKQHANTELGKATELEASDGTVIGDKKTGFTFPIAPPSGATFQLVGASKSTSAFDQIVPPKESNAQAPLFSFGLKRVEIPSTSFPYSSSISDSSVLKSGAPLEPGPESTTSFANFASATSTVPGIPESDKGSDGNLQKSGDTVGKSEASASCGLSTSTANIFSFGAPPKNICLNGSLSSSSSIFGSPSPSLASSILANSFNSVASSTTAAAANGTASNGSQSTSAAGPLFPTAPIFQFGTTSVAPANSVSTVSTVSTAEPIDVKAKTEKGTILGNLTGSPFGSTSLATASTGSNIFGFNAPASSSTTNNLSQASLLGTSSVSTPFQFGSSALSTISGTTGTTSSTSLFGSSTSSTSPFGSSTSSSTLFGLPASKPIDSSSGFGLSSSATNSNSSSGPSSSLLGSTWQPPKSAIFSSTTESQPAVFSFGASSVSAAATNSAPMVFGSSSGSLFSFTSAAAASPSSSQMQPVFGSSDQMNMEDSMAEDQPTDASTPTVPVFGQTPISNPSSGFVFGSVAPSTGNPFQFGGQQNQSTPQNPSPFQASGSQFGGQQNQNIPQTQSPFQMSGSVDFGAAAGNSFSLGSAGGDDKANRRIVRIKHKNRRR